MRELDGAFCIYFLETSGDSGICNNRKANCDRVLLLDFGESEFLVGASALLANS